MLEYGIVALVHLFSAVLLVGFTLFWIVMASQLRRRFDEAETDRHLELINRGGWPPVAVPESYRFSLAGWAAGFLIVLVVTGVLLLEILVARPEVGIDPEGFGSFFDKTLHVKLIFTGMLVAGLASLAKQPRPWLVYFNGVTVLIIVLLSALLGN